MQYCGREDETKGQDTERYDDERVGLGGWMCSIVFKYSYSAPQQP